MSSTWVGNPGSPWKDRPSNEWGEWLGVPHVDLHRSLASTNEHLRTLAAEGAPPFTTVIAEGQSRGIGRAGRRWHSPRGGGLWISVLLPASPEPSRGVISIAVGVSAARAIERVARISIDLKWPNDALVRSRKVAGVLCQASTGLEHGVVAGVGVNLRPVEGGSHQLEREVADGIGYLEEMAEMPVPEPELAAALITELQRWANPVAAALDGALMLEWDARDCLRGRSVQVEGRLHGVACGLAADGALLVAADGEPPVAVYAGGVRLDEDGASPALYRSSKVAHSRRSG